MLLTAAEARVLGSLMEKETTTPETYPLSLNALVAACNQKSSREPVMQLSERDAEIALRSLEDQNLVSVNHGSRVERYENRARTVFHLRRDEAAVLCLLLLRGPQTPGELRSRADRLHTFDDVPAVASAIARLAAPLEGTAREALVTTLPRQPGAREQRVAHLLCGTPSTAEPAGRETPQPALSEQVAALEARVATLEQALRSAGLLPTV